ncbi:preprotein translocase subunit SecE [Alkalimarinus coralli]|uniref:preprotein translocase subunit SecE n=1 Tax=Alkalimarinus coralli TaxID=2935863 RepID=UPI00202B0439|nr:preprotein translocase subunit SecE [Alkalimarinus coralli]
MNAKVEVDESRFDGLKWFSVVALVVVAVAGNHYFSAESLLYRVLALLVLASVAGFIALQTLKGKKFSALLKDAKSEIRKVVWPTRQELTQTTMIVIVFVLVVALILWGLDSLISWLVSGLIG